MFTGDKVGKQTTSSMLLEELKLLTGIETDNTRFLLKYISNQGRNLEKKMPVTEARVESIESMFSDKKEADFGSS